MNFTGIILNPVLIIIFGLVGVFFGEKIPESIKDNLMNGLGLCILFLAITGIEHKGNIVVSILAIAFGGAFGEWIDFDGRITRLGQRVEDRFAKGNGQFAQGFVNGTLLFCMGAMSVTGAIESGMEGTATIFIAKSFIDAVISLVLAANLGFGVVAASSFVLVYQFFLTLLSSGLSMVVNDAIVSQMSFTGSILLMAIGLNLLDLTEIKVSNYIISPFICIPLMKIPLLTNL